jgi:hypothetical protein
MLLLIGELHHSHPAIEALSKGKGRILKLSECNPDLAYQLTISSGQLSVSLPLAGINAMRPVSVVLNVFCPLQMPDSPGC